MKIAIHHTRKNAFSERWINYCRENQVLYKIVNAYDSDIILQVEDCDAFMFHHHQANYKDVLLAKQLLYSLQIAGKKVFPDFNTTWHFDDKVGQKYLLEAIGAPLVPAYVFYTKEEAIEWIKSSTFPKVFKLRGGAGAANVRLVKSKKEALALTRKAFNGGFQQYDWKSKFKEAMRKFRLGKASVRDVLRPLYYAMKPYPTIFAKYRGKERGYVYFQDYIPDNEFDIRIIIVDDKAFAIKRINRKNDFRASGSGSIVYDKEEIDQRCVEVAFDINTNLKSQSIGFDFIFDASNTPLIVEVSYAFPAAAYDPCPGYWDRQLNWHEEPFNPYGWMVNMMMEKAR